MRNMKIVVKNNKGKWFWKLLGSNGRTLAHSEIYNTKAKAVKTAKVVAANMMRVGIIGAD